VRPVGLVIAVVGWLVGGWVVGYVVGTLYIHVLGLVLVEILPIYSSIHPLILGMYNPPPMIFAQPSHCPLEEEEEEEEEEAFALCNHYLMRV